MRHATNCSTQTRRRTRTKIPSVSSRRPPPQFPIRNQEISRVIHNRKRKIDFYLSVLRTIKIVATTGSTKKKVQVFQYSSPMFVFNQHSLILFCFFFANKVIFSILFFPLLLQNTSSHTYTHTSTVHHT